MSLARGLYRGVLATPACSSTLPLTNRLPPLLFLRRSASAWKRSRSDLRHTCAMRCLGSLRHDALSRRNCPRASPCYHPSSAKRRHRCRHVAPRRRRLLFVISHAGRHRMSPVTRCWAPADGEPHTNPTWHRSSAPSVGACRDNCRHSKRNSATLLRRHRGTQARLVNQLFTAD